MLVVDRDLVSLQETEDRITRAGGSAKVLIVDLAVEQQVPKIAPACIEAFGFIDILHNNVGIGTGDGGVTSLDREAWERIFDVNVTGMHLTCKHVIPALCANGGDTCQINARYTIRKQLLTNFFLTRQNSSVRCG